MKHKKWTHETLTQNVNSECVIIYLNKLVVNCGDILGRWTKTSERQVNAKIDIWSCVATRGRVGPGRSSRRPARPPALASLLHTNTDHT